MKIGIVGTSSPTISVPDPYGEGVLTRFLRPIRP
jgi:hypothetical protein